MEDSCYCKVVFGVINTRTNVDAASFDGNAELDAEYMRGKGKIIFYRKYGNKRYFKKEIS